MCRTGRERPQLPRSAPRWRRASVPSCRRPLRRGDLAASAVPPDLLLLVPPAAVAQVLHNRTMGPPADLAVALGPHEPDPMADLRPVDRVEVTQLRLNRHGRVPTQTSRVAVRARGRWR